MGQTRTDEFRKDAVHIALTSGLTRRQVAGDLGVGFMSGEETTAADQYKSSCGWCKADAGDRS